MWFGCTSHGLVADDVMMCWTHARIIHERIQGIEDLTNQRIDAELDKNKQWQIAEQTARITAGKPERADLFYRAPSHRVYYIKIGEQIKIGFTADLDGRLNSYPPNAEILGIEYGDKELEKQRHRQFHAYLAYGREWFHDTQEIRDHIATLPNWKHLIPKRMRRGAANSAATIKPRYWR